MWTETEHNHGSSQESVDDLPAGPSEEELFQFLKVRPDGVTEYDLLRRFIPDDGQFGDGKLALFRRHFLLYHHLYLLRDRVEDAGWYLDVGPAFVRLIPFPSGGACRYFDPENGRFCGLPTEAASERCPAHEHATRSRRDSGSIGRVGLRGYYLEPRNYHTMDEATLELWMSGVKRYALQFEQIESARRMLGLPVSFTVDRLKRRYRFLSKKQHPDAGGSDRHFADLQEAYQILFWYCTGIAGTE